MIRAQRRLYSFGEVALSVMLRISHLFTLDIGKCCHDWREMKMPQGTKHQSTKITKLLNIGDSGSGKTGALACLLKGGYRLIIVDFDNGLDILVGILRDDKEALDRMYFETFTDRLKLVNQMIVPVGEPKAFVNAMNGLERWKFRTEPGSEEYYDLGSAFDWGPDTVLVIDSLGFAGEAALRLVRQMNGHQFDKFVAIPDWGQAMIKIEGLLQILHSKSIKCHVIVNSHITYIEDAIKGTQRGLPRALGSKLPPKVGGYFNSLVRSETIGSGKSAKRIIRTTSESGVELKLPVAPGTVKDELPISDGLLTIFKTLQRHEWTEESSKQGE